MDSNFARLPKEMGNVMMPEHLRSKVSKFDKSPIVAGKFDICFVHRRFKHLSFSKRPIEGGSDEIVE